MRFTCLLTLLSVTGLTLKAQQPAVTSTATAAEKDGLKYNINENGSHFIQATIMNQVWFRYNQSNPGTMVDGKAADQTFDIGLRRTRMQLFGQITDKVFVYFQFGQNNFNSQYNYGGQRKQAAFFHDALCEYKVTKGNQLKLGGGLTIANGLSRFSQPSVGTIMTMDVPVFAQATVDQTDQFSRKLSMFARGQLGKHIDYRVAVSDPFPINSNGTVLPAISTNANFTQKGHTKQYQAYLMWQFFEQETHLTPYMTGTYLGKKKVFNIALGGISQANAMWRKDAVTGDTLYDNMLLLCAESFLDMPLNKEKGTAISAYAGYFKNDYGKNYLRYNGIMNPATSSNLSNPVTGASGTWGNAVPMFGTGSVVYSQVGYLMSKELLKGHGQLMPYVSATMAKYDRLGSNQTNVYNAGVNWFINGHKAKITLDYQNRPTFTQDASGTVSTGDRKSCVTMQYQIMF